MRVLIFLIMIFAVSCNQSTPGKVTKVDTLPDPPTTADGSIVAGSIPSEPSPVEVTSAKLVTDEFGSTDVVVTLKNTSTKTIDGTKVKWTLTNNFGETVDDLRSAGIGQKILKPGKSVTYNYTIYRTAAKKVDAKIYEAHFTDGSKWSLTN